MRCEIGSIINLFNEGSGEFESKVIEKTKKKIILEVVKKIEYEKITNNFDLVFCPPKSNKLDTLIQKCTEIGVNSFIPIISDHTVSKFATNITQDNKAYFHFSTSSVLFFVNTIKITPTIIIAPPINNS